MLKPHTAIWRSIRKSFDFRGRSQRSEFWWTNVFLILAGVALILFDDWWLSETALNTYESAQSKYGFASWLADWRYYPTSMTFNYLTIPVFATVGMRRLHDIGRSGWPAIILTLTSLFLTYIEPYAFDRTDSSNLLFIPEGFGFLSIIRLPFFVVGLLIAILSIYILICAIFDSHVADNKYGPSPKYGSQKAVFD